MDTARFLGIGLQAMEKADPEENARKSNAGHSLGPSIVGSSFGDNNKLHLGDINYHCPTSLRDLNQLTDRLTLQTSDSFLSHVSAIHPQNQRSLIKTTNSNWYSEAFVEFFVENKEFKTWLAGGSGQLLWVRDETGSGYLLLAAKMLDAFESNASFQGFVVSHFFCEETQPKTATDVLAGLVYGLLINPRCEESVLPHVQRLFSRRIKNIQTEKSRFAVLGDMLIESISKIHQVMPMQQLVMLIAGSEHCVNDAFGNGISSLLDLASSIAKSHPNIKWIVNSRLAAATQGGLQESGIGLRTLAISPVSTAMALGLAEILPKVIETGRKLCRIHQGFSKSQKSADDVSWFSHCSAAILWLKPRGLVSRQESRLLWYRRGSVSATIATPSFLGVHIASDKFLFGGRVFPKVYFSFASLFPSGSTGPPTTEPHDLLAKALWGIVTQLIVSVCGSESAIAAFLSSLSYKSRRELIQTFCLTFGPESLTPRASPTLHPQNAEASTWEGDNANDWLKKAETLSKRHLPMLSNLMESVLQVIYDRNDNAILVLDSVELLQPSDFRPLIQLLRNLGHGLRILICVKTISEPTNDTNGDWDSSSDDWVDELTEYRECLRSLQFKSMHQRRYQIVDSLADTNQWLWVNDEYMKWRHDGGLLWISGKAGSGKSVLAKTILQRLRHDTTGSLDAKPWSVCGWFYSARGIPGGTQHDSMLRTLIFELIANNMEAFDAMKAIYRKLVVECDGLVTWPLDILPNVLLLLSGSSSIPNTVAVIDAFDESENDSNHQDARANITSVFRQLVDLSSGRMRMIFLSRPEVDIAKGFRNFHHISVQANNQGDISKIVDNGIFNIQSAWSKIMANPDWSSYNADQPPTASHRAPDPIVLPSEVEVEIENMRKYLVLKASGVTLWVVLVLKDLYMHLQSEDCFTISDLRAALESLPVDLEELYLHFRSMQQSQISKNPKRPSYSKSMLTWIVGSQRWAPLQLDELREAIAILDQGLWSSGTKLDVSREGIANKRIQIGNNWERFCRLVYQQCGPLVEIHRADDRSTSVRACGKAAYLGASTIELAHETVKKFFRDQEKSGHLSIDPEAAEMAVVTTSYSYLGVPHQAQRTPSGVELNTQVKTDILEILLASISKTFGFQPQCPALVEFFRARPLARFALQVIYRASSATSLSRAVRELDEGALAAQDRFITHWVADLCFTPTTPDTNIRHFVNHCCLHGRCDLLEYTSCLTEREYTGLHQSPYGRAHRLRKHRRNEIVGGAIEALSEISTEHWSCFRSVAERLREEVVRIAGSDTSIIETDSQFLLTLGPRDALRTLPVIAPIHFTQFDFSMVHKKG
ncbi:Ankyrin repeat protein [Colletotrichum higginsianum IMI 349063]|uniref:Ankyrin repeat protein n=1 Tax=Colletotrichum higginsianum (strain IMI 349063) TaxID=759273 RepID=A0A1B7Y042_COLHI|nr:Ankyrin repeat protein [Colletotrichum higginsianum IMI 349063]OBR05383.1 Ankyrin repeat protein [Colletotrichum higginsianum IMI 349063]